MSEPSVCPMNIGPRERRKRLIIGLVALAVAAGAMLVFLALGVNKWWRLTMFLPLWFGLLAVMEARVGT